MKIGFKSKWMVRALSWLSKLFTFVILLSSLTTPATVLAGPMSCENLFHENAAHLIGMNRLYEGEDKGAYIDPVTKTPWKVKYFTEGERAPYELKIKDGRFYDLNGKRAESEYDGESMSFETSLLVIDKEFRIFVLPFESRGEYHHSSLSRGEDVLFAGTVAFSQGILREITNSSGHYKPTGQDTLYILKRLAGEGALYPQTKIGGQAALELSKQYSVQWKELLDAGF